MRNCAITMESEIPDNEMNALLNQLACLDLQGKHLEIGTAAGGTLCKLCSFYKEHKNEIPQFWVVDPMKYFNDQLIVIKKNLQKNNIEAKKIRFLICKSRQAQKIAKIENPSFDFMLIDGSHKQKYVTEDLMWSRFLRVGGLLCAHDFSPQFPGVFRSINEFLKNYKNYKVLFTEGSLIGIQKVAPYASHEVSLGMIFNATVQGFLSQITNSLSKRMRFN